MQRNAYLATKEQALNYYRLETILHLVWPRCSSLLTARLAWIITCHQHAYRHILNTFLTGCIHKKYCIIQFGVVEIRPIESGNCAASGSPAQAWTDPRRQGKALAALPLGHFSAPRLHQSHLEGWCFPPGPRMDVLLLELKVGVPQALSPGWYLNPVRTQQSHTQYFRCK